MSILKSTSLSKGFTISTSRVPNSYKLMLLMVRVFIENRDCTWATNSKHMAPAIEFPFLLFWKMTLPIAGRDVFA